MPVQRQLTVAAPAASSNTGSESIVVTGSLFRDPNTTSASPITHLTATDLQTRGVKSAADALQLISSNGAGTLTNAWSAGGGFAAGASAPSLRGLSTDSTLVLMDGQRLSYYPAADDGERNFVDTNWIPISIMQNVDVLEDGGSATYGADAVAGVINFIPRKSIQGWEGDAEGGVAQNGQSGHQRLFLTYGHGDLARDHYNFYINGEYQQDDAYYYRDAGSPYNNGDLTRIGGTNGNDNVSDGAGGIANFSPTTTALVRPSNGGTSGVGPWQLLNPSAGCAGTGTLITGAVAGATGTSTACTMNSERFAQISPDLRRLALTGHLTVNVTDHSQLTAMFNYSQVRSTVTGTTPSAVRVQSQSTAANTLSASLPAILPNGQLNPNDPFAAQGQAAEIEYLFGDLTPTTEEFSQNYRGSVRYNGWVPSTWGGDWDYDANFVGMNTVLDQTITGIPTIAGIDNAIATGSYNFVNPSLNSQAVLDSIAPKNHIAATTQEYSGEATLSKGLFHLPGGMAKLAIGANVRYEALNDPSANPYDPEDPTAQYTGLINPVNAHGHRWVESGFFEADLPLVKMLDADVSGRFDHYSEGFSHFSPKVGVTFKPIQQAWLRGTFSKGFRVPSFAETGGSNIGYTTYNPANDPVGNAAFIAAHPNSTYAQAYLIGVNSAGNPNLKPETSTNWSIGPILRPTNWLTVGATYYYIKKEHFIAPNPIPTVTAANDILQGLPLPNGVTYKNDISDTQNPGGQLRPSEIDLGYVNTNKLVTDGFDLTLDAHSRLPGFLRDVMWTSKAMATFVHRYNLTLPDGSVEHFAGTIGPYAAVSASGTPRWRANWSNTFIYKKFSATPTVYYTSGYKTAAEDETGAGSSAGCANILQSSSFVPQTQCHVKGFWDVDLTLQYNLTKNLQVYANIYNLLGFRAPYDFATYGGNLYNPAWSQNGIVYRNFQFGVHATF